MEGVPSFRPLAGLSCINHECTDYDVYVYAQEFPSPRGVELHKPRTALDYSAREIPEFPSPRGVELHKP